MFRTTLDELPGRLTKAQLLEIVGRSEHEGLDFKRKLEPDDQRHVAAMAMTDGGWLIAGVDDAKRRHELVGWELTERRRDLVMGTLSGQIGVTVTVRQISVDGVPVTVVAVPSISNRVVTTTDGRILRRRGTASVPLLGDEVARFVRERSTISATHDELAYEVDAIDWSVVRDVFDRADREFPERDPFHALVELGVAHERPGDPRGRIATLACFLLFGRSPTTLIPGAGVQLVRRAGRQDVDAPVSRRETHTSPLITLVDSVVDAIMNELPAVEVVAGRRRQRVLMVPETAIREVVLNALAHRDYGIPNATIDVLVTDDAVEVRSPGGLPGHITLENMLDEHYSRNKPLMDILRLAGLVEQFGDGVDRIYEDMAERLLPEPVFAATQSSVTVLLRTTSGLSLEDQVWLDTLSDVTLDRDDRRVLLAVRRSGPIARRDAAQLPLEGEASAVLASMVSRRLLTPRGRRGGRVYALSEEVIARAGDTSIARERRRRDQLLSELGRRGIEGLASREAATLLGDDELRHARQMLNDLVRAGEARAEGNTAARRYYAVDRPTALPPRRE